MNLISRRHFVRGSAIVGAGLAARPSKAFSSANDEIRLGFIGCGGRAGEHLSVFSKMEGVKIAGLCDPDQSRLDAARQHAPDAKIWTDLRVLIDDKDIDAVVIATCNHWHCLASIWAMEAGKDVYVEKPLSHSQWEGLQTVAATRKYQRVCQVGTQQRSDPMQDEIKKFLHVEKAIGEIVSARVNRFGIRDSIGKRNEPLPVDPKMDFNLWLGPAADQPILRNKLQYDWHWDWNTGSGEMGNWGVHVLDDVRNVVFEDEVTLPKRIMGGGGRFVWDDAGETPNVHFAYFDTGSIPVVIALSNLPGVPDGKKSPKHPGPDSGYVVYCQAGRLEGQRGSAVAYDLNGEVVRKFSGNSGNQLHQQNFIDAVRKQDPRLLNAEVVVGHHSTGWCNLANIAFRTGTEFNIGDAEKLEVDSWHQLIAEIGEHLNAHSIALTDPNLKLGPILHLAPEKEVFFGQNADIANAFMKRKYRAPFEVPEIFTMARQRRRVGGPIQIQ